MRKETIIRFLNKPVKLVDEGEFALCGTIDEVYDDALLFTTKQTSSLIALDTIRRIVLLSRR